MPVRAFLRAVPRWLLLGALCAMPGCSDDGGTGGDDRAALVRLTDETFPDDATGAAAEALATEIVAAADAGDDAAAEAKAYELAELTLAEFGGGRLPRTAAQLDTYLTDVFGAAGVAVAPLSAASLGSEGIVAVIRPAGGTFVSASRRAGLQVPAGAVSRPVLLVATRLADSSAYAPGDGPLPTDADQYPLFYEFDLVPDVTLDADAVLGLCQVTEPASAYYAPDPVFARLQLAHPDPADRTTIALLPRVDAPFLECDGVTANARRASLLARRAGIGGRVRKFSPFAAVDAPAGPLPDGTLEPVGYRSFSDSPFNGRSFSFFFLEDWEDGLINTPGVTSSSTSLGSSFGAGLVDAVDGDDGVVDGRCVKTAGNCESGFAGGSITFSFNPAALDGYPTHVGVVWTDGGFGTDVTFEAFGPTDQSLGTRTVTALGDGSNFGTVEEDRFFGVVASGGVRRIEIRNSSGGLEVDHLQYGR